MIESLDLNFDVPDTLSVDDETAGFISKIKFHHEQKVNQLDDLVQAIKETPRLDLGGVQIDDPDQVKGVRIGLQIAKSIIGDFPIKISKSADEED